MRSVRLPVALPEFLEIDLFDKAWDLAQKWQATLPDAFCVFSIGWHGLAYRSRTFQECQDNFEMLWESKHIEHSHEGNFLQDQAFVNFLFNACSSIECWAYAVYGALSIYAPDMVPIAHAKELRQVNRSAVAKKCGEVPGINSLQQIAVELACSSIAIELFDLRDTVAHRGTLPYTVYAGGDRYHPVTVPSNPKALPSEMVSDLPVSPDTTQRFGEWLHRTLRAGIVATHALLETTGSRGRGEVC
jgi:hypothetical protein